MSRMRSAVRWLFLFLLAFSAIASCKKRSVETRDASATTPTTAVTPSPVAPEASARAQDAGPGGAIDRDGDSYFLHVLAVSSRVDNDTERPEALIDGTTDTAWSSATGDLEGAWIGFDVDSPLVNVFRAVHLTVGMTRNDALFTQNPRIAEVSIGWSPVAPDDTWRRRVPPETVIVASAKLDPDSTKLQRIPLDLRGPGRLRITVKRVKLGTNPSWREITISEVVFEDENGHLMRGFTPEIAVGGFEQKPRSKLGIAPEAQIPLRCLAIDPRPDGPGAICAIGRRLDPAVLVAIDSKEATKLADLTGDVLSGKRIPWPAWRRVEKGLGGSVRSLDRADRWLDWGATVTLPNGSTFRSRETRRGPTATGSVDAMNGVVEVQFPGSDAFAPVLPEFVEDMTRPRTSVIVLDHDNILVERTPESKAPGRFSWGADAAVCNVQRKRCFSYAAPPATP
jgi:hypothetical protein